MTGWHPVLRSEEAVARHVAFVRLFDMEIALWRDDAGRLNAWQNRCPHRGMRLTLGTNTGTELKCRYHGWRFASGTGACTFIPAHPAQTPPKAAVVPTYRTTERYGFVWIGLGDPAHEPDVPGLLGAPLVTLRSVTIGAPERDVSAALAAQPPSPGVVYLVQAQSASVTTVHGAAPIALAGDQRPAFLREQNERLKALRRALESVTA